MNKLNPFLPIGGHFDPEKLEKFNVDEVEQSLETALF